MTGSSFNHYKQIIFVTQTNIGTVVKRVPQEQMVGVRSYPSRKLLSALFRVCQVEVVLRCFKF